MPIRKVLHCRKADNSERTIKAASLGGACLKKRLSQWSGVKCSASVLKRTIACILNLSLANASPEKFENGVFTFKTHQCFPSIIRWREKQSISVIIVASSLSKSSIFKMFSDRWHKYAELAFSNGPFLLRRFAFHLRPRDILHELFFYSSKSYFSHIHASI